MFSGFSLPNARIPLSNRKYATTNHQIVFSSPLFHPLEGCNRETICFATTEKTLEEEATEQIDKASARPRIVMESGSYNASDCSDDTMNSATEEDDEYDDSEDEVDEEEVQRRRRAVIAARLVKNGSTTTRLRSAAVSASQAMKNDAKSTSVGTRREGSASKARSSSGGLSGSLLRGVKSGAIAAAAAARKKAMEDKTGKHDTASSGSMAAVKKGIVQSTIDAFLETQKELRIAREKSIQSVITQEPQVIGSQHLALPVMPASGGSTAAVKKCIIQSTIDAFLESQYELRVAREKSIQAVVIQVPQVIGSQHLALPVTPSPGTVLVDQPRSKITNPMDVQDRTRNSALVRVATMKDDMEIAKLRLSVFSDFTPEIRRQFRTRSCEVLGYRRMKGATCLVASVNYYNAELEYERYEKSRHKWIIGSVECSTHEFAGTQLGMSRPGGSIMYITEVAVAPRVRRTGAGTKLLQGIDELAKRRNVETVYLHVDVSNTAACELYEKGGYEILDSNDPIYNEFTTQLNLHDGATKGRNHYMLQKRMTKQQTWLGCESLPENNDYPNIIGFEVSDLI